MPESSNKKAVPLDGCKAVISLFMVCFPIYDLKAPVYLFKEDHPHHLMGKSHF